MLNGHVDMWRFLVGYNVVRVWQELCVLMWCFDDIDLCGYKYCVRDFVNVNGQYKIMHLDLIRYDSLV